MRVYRFRPPVLSIGEEYELVYGSTFGQAASSDFDLDRRREGAVRTLNECADSHAATARSLRKLAGTLIESEDLELDPALDWIYVDGPIDRLDELVRQGLIEAVDLGQDEPAEEYVAHSILREEDAQALRSLDRTAQLVDELTLRRSGRQDPTTRMHDQELGFEVGQVVKLKDGGFLPRVIAGLDAFDPDGSVECWWFDEDNVLRKARYFTEELVLYTDVED